MIHPREMATVWVIRGGDRDRRVASFLADGSIGVEFPDLPDGRSVDRAKAIRLLATDPDAAPPEADVAMFLSFVRRIDVGDIVVMPDPQEKGLVCGVVSGDYEYRDAPNASEPRHRRAVEWRRRLPVARLPERLDQIPKQRKKLDDVADGRLRDLAMQCCLGELGDDPHVRTSPPVRAASRSPRTRKPPRPPKATTPERRCMGCFVSKPAALFDDGSDWCRDCR